MALVGALVTGVQLFVGAVTGVGMVPLIKSFIPPDPPALTTTVRLVIGNVQDVAASLSGNVPGIALWTEYGEFIGSTHGTKDIISKGNFYDINVVANQRIGNVPAAYISVVNGGDDALCIAGIVLTNPDKTQSGWTGDIAAQCPNTKASVYQQDQPIGDFTDGKTLAPRPYCVWIDRDGSNDIPHQGFGVHLRDFGPMVTTNQTDAYNKDNTLMCSSLARFGMYEKLTSEEPTRIYQPPLAYNLDGTDTDTHRVIGVDGTFAYPTVMSKRTALPVPHVFRDRVHARHYPLPSNDTAPQAMQNVSVPVATSSSNNSNNGGKTSTNNTDGSAEKPKRHRFDGHCIISDKSHSSALHLCEHPNTYGPSMASTVEGLFCDMIEKRLFKICGAQIKVNDPTIDSKIDPMHCFDVAEVNLRTDTSKKSVSNAVVEGNTSAKMYSTADMKTAERALSSPITTLVARSDASSSSISAISTTYTAVRHW